MKAAVFVFLLGGVAQADITERALASQGAYDTAVRLADEVGARIAGSPAADRAVAWAVKELKDRGFDVKTEAVTVNGWQRGSDDRVELLGPSPRVLHALSLGRSPATAKGGLEAEVVEVASYDELAKLGDKVKGKIVFYDPIMKRSTAFDEYGRVGAMRFNGAVTAAKAGAVAAIIRSVGTGSHRLPHTGATVYDDTVPKIPFVALATEDALLLHRALGRGPQKLRLTLSDKMRAPVQSANVVADVNGTDKPDEIVVLGAHLDSWDVGDGALDDGAGVGIAMETLRLVKEARPKRTVRVVLFMNEECGLDGGRAYAQKHAAELGKHVAVVETDAGGGAPRALGVIGNEAAKAWVRKLAAPISTLVPGSIELTEEVGADVASMVSAGVPGVAIEQDMSDYFEWHHTEGDTADKLDARAMRMATAVYATMVLGLANAPDALPRVAPKPPKR